MSKHYRVTWSIDVELDDIDPIDAVNDCWIRLHEHGNDWLWEVKDMDTGQEYEVDYEYTVVGELPQITEITNNK